MARGKRTRQEYRKKSNSHYGNGSKANPDYKRPHEQGGYNFQRTKLLSRPQKSKLVMLAKGA